MKLLETSTIPVFDLPLQAFRDHLRTGSGFADDAVQDVFLETVLRAALSAIEARTGKALMTRNFRWTISGWRSPDAQALPVAPVVEITGLKLIGRSGDETPFDLACVQLIEDTQRPVLRSVCHSLPRIPAGGMAELSFVAGYSQTWEELPDDLKLAVMVLAAYFYENRGDASVEDGNVPLPVKLLTERYRTVRILGGAGA